MQARPASANFERVRRWTPRLLWILPVAYFATVVAGVTSAPGPEPLVIEDGVRFGLDEKHRRAIYSEIARYRDEWERLAARAFPGDEWSQHDDFHNRLGRQVLALADRHGLHYSEVFLIYDEGVRKHWTGPRGETLPATWVPLQPRKH